MQIGNTAYISTSISCPGHSFARTMFGFVGWHGQIAPELLDLTLFALGCPTRLPDMTSAWSNSSRGSVMPGSRFGRHTHAILR